MEQRGSLSPDVALFLRELSHQARWGAQSRGPFPLSLSLRGTGEVQPWNLPAECRGGGGVLPLCWGVLSRPAAWVALTRAPLLPCLCPSLGYTRTHPPERHA